MKHETLRRPVFFFRVMVKGITYRQRMAGVE